MGIPALPLAQRDAAAEQPDWIATEPAGAFSVGDCLEHQWERINALADREARAAVRARWQDGVTSFHYLLIAHAMYGLFRHPALAHVRVVELRTPRQAEFWLMSQQRRREG